MPTNFPLQWFAHLVFFYHIGPTSQDGKAHRGATLHQLACPDR